MNIGMVCYPTYGGSGVVATELGKALARKGHRVHFISYQEPVRLDAFNANVYYHEVPQMEYPLFQHLPYESALASKIVDVALFQQLDLLHVHYAIPHASAAFMAVSILKSKGVKLPFITTLHGTDITLVGKDPAYAPVVEFSINQSDGITAVSESLRKDTFQSFDVKKPIEVIPNFIDFQRFRKINKEHFKKLIAPQGEMIVVHVSNFRPVKRVQDCILAFHEFSKKVPSRLLLVGDGPERANMEHLCRQLGVCDQVRFLGKQEAIEDLLAVADLFMLPSESESFGLAALEAMACEVPVLSSDAGGLPEINLHGKTGMLSPVGDVQSLAANAVNILSDENRLNTFRKNALEQARRFDLEHILPKYESYYFSVVKNTQEA